MRVAIKVGTRHLWPAIGLKIPRERASSARSAIFRVSGLAERGLRHTQGRPSHVQPRNLSVLSDFQTADSSICKQTAVVSNKFLVPPLHPSLRLSPEHGPAGSRQQKLIWQQGGKHQSTTAVFS